MLRCFHLNHPKASILSYIAQKHNYHQEASHCSMCWVLSIWFTITFSPTIPGISSKAFLLFNFLKKPNQFVTLCHVLGFCGCFLVSFSPFLCPLCSYILEFIPKGFVRWEGTFQLVHCTSCCFPSVPNSYCQAVERLTWQWMYLSIVKVCLSPYDSQAIFAKERYFDTISNPFDNNLSPKGVGICP